MRIDSWNLENLEFPEFQGATESQPKFWELMALPSICSRTMFISPLLVLKGIYHYWTYFDFLTGGLSKWKLPNTYKRWSIFFSAPPRWPSFDPCFCRGFAVGGSAAAPMRQFKLSLVLTRVQSRARTKSQSGPSINTKMFISLRARIGFPFLTGARQTIVNELWDTSYLLSLLLLFAQIFTSDHFEGNEPVPTNWYACSIVLLSHSLSSWTLNLLGRPF